MNLGFIGLGRMGLPMTINLLTSGFIVYVYDLDRERVERARERGAIPSESPADVAKNASTIFLSLPTPKAVKEVILGRNGLLASAIPNTVIIDLSTSDPLLTKKIAEEIAERGVEMLDAPVSGGVKGAAEGKLSIMVGGKRDIFEKCRGILEILGEDLYYVGSIGSGHTVKLINQLLVGLNTAAIAEAWKIGLDAGLSEETMFRIIKSSSGNSKVFEVKFPKIIEKDFSPGFSIDLMLKDLNLINDLGDALKIPLLLSKVAKYIYEEAVNNGLGCEDTAAVIKKYMVK